MKKSSGPIKTKDIPATQGMLYGVRDELKSDIASLTKTMNSRFKDVEANFQNIEARFQSVDSRFQNIEARFQSVDARFINVDARFDKLESKIDKVLSVVHRTHTLVEEQEARNRYVLDGYNLLRDRQDRFEDQVNERFETIEKIISNK